MVCYNITKSKLPRLRTIKRKRTRRNLPAIRLDNKYPLVEQRLDQPYYKRKTKRKFSRKQLAAQRLFAKRARAGTLRR